MVAVPQPPVVRRRVWTNEMLEQLEELLISNHMVWIPRARHRGTMAPRVGSAKQLSVDEIKRLLATEGRNGSWTPIANLCPIYPKDAAGRCLVWA